MLECLKNSIKITSEVAEYINHNYGNIKKDGYIRQYVFKEGDNTEDVIEFLKFYYPELCEEF